MAEALSSPDEFGGALAPSPTAFAVRRPGREEWFRCHPTFQPAFSLYEVNTSKRRNAVYLIRKPLIPLFGEAARPCTLRLCVNSQGSPFIWPLKHSMGGPSDSWAKSRFEVAQAAVTGWIAIEPGDGCYLIRHPERPDIFPTPAWPEGTPNDWLNKAFAGAIVTGAEPRAAVFWQAMRDSE